MAKKLTTYEFEVFCKNVVIDFCKKHYHEEYQIQDISVVWMCKTLEHKKCILIDNGDNQRMYELTENGKSDCLYFDAYVKQVNTRYDMDDENVAQFIKADWFKKEEE